MVTFVIEKPDVRPYGSGYVVTHPTNDAILAYCDTEKEAASVVHRLEELGALFKTKKKP